MTEFPNKIILIQDKETKEIFDFWVLQDHSAYPTREYISFEKACKWLNEFAYFSVSELTGDLDTDDLIKRFKEAMDE